MNGTEKIWGGERLTYEENREEFRILIEMITGHRPEPDDRRQQYIGPLERPDPELIDPDGFPEPDNIKFEHVLWVPFRVNLPIGEQTPVHERMPWHSYLRQRQRAAEAAYIRIGAILLTVGFALQLASQLFG